MWNFNTDINKWELKTDSLKVSDYDYLKQELESTRFYSKCLSGATYLPVNDVNNIYDILNEYKPRNWFVNNSPYAVSFIPSSINNLRSIDSNTSYEYYDKYANEYGMTLKNLFTPDRLIKDSIKNFLYVDVATTKPIDLDLTYSNLTIDGIKILNNHRILVKDQISLETLSIDVNPSDYFQGNFKKIQEFGATTEYSYFNSDNGIYEYINNKLVKTNELSDYNDCIRYSVVVKLGVVNTQKQFHLSRLLNGYFPTNYLNEPIEFIEKHNWIIRNRVDYNNLFEINYYDVIKSKGQTFSTNNREYVIPERTISVGEFGVILNTQYLISNIIPNKYKVNLRSIIETTKFYWICGDDGTLLKVNKHDFLIQKVNLDTIYNLKSISFLTDLKGVIVGSFNTILTTEDGGLNWTPIFVDDFDGFSYNKVRYTEDNIFIIGDNGVLLELVEDIYGWSVYKRRISRYIDKTEENILVDNINDMIFTKFDSTLDWNITLSGNTQSVVETDKEIMLLVTDDNKVIACDLNNSIPNFDFLYLDFNNEYGNIKNITQKSNSTIFYIGTDTNGINFFDINDFNSVGVAGNSYSNTMKCLNTYSQSENLFTNRLFTYDDELVICGNDSLLLYSQFVTPLDFERVEMNLESRLKSRLLFLDYDIASKLNFFTDNGEYRLPIDVSFDTINFEDTNKSKLWFEPNIRPGSIRPELSWMDYWKDTEKVFRYYTSYDDSNAILPSTTFTYRGVNELYFTPSEMTTDKNESYSIAPSHFYGGSQIISTSNPIGGLGTSTNNKVFIYGNLLILKTIPNFNVNEGDILKITSSDIEVNLMVNRISNAGDKYIYMFTSFNDEINKSILENPLSVKNLNTYKTKQELSDNFNTHPISKGYGLELVDNAVRIYAKFNNETSYYNLATKVLAKDNTTTSLSKRMKYLDSFLKFGYSPTYNILDYLESLNDGVSVYSLPAPNRFSYDKEYLAMPHYVGVPMPGGLSFNSNQIYIDYNLVQNKLSFGENRKAEWESLFINTFVDVIIHTNSGDYTSERMLVMKKYIDTSNTIFNGDLYIIEFHKAINYPLGTPHNSIDILSRRKLGQISNDLQEVNNIQRGRFKSKSLVNGMSFTNLERDLNFKISTDSYVKILLSDVDTTTELSGLVYTDYKNELAMNITKLDREYSIPIRSTESFDDGFGEKLLVSCSEKHGLSTYDGVVLEFDGGEDSSEFLNPQYFGFHNIFVVDQFNFYIDTPYGQDVVLDTGFVKFIKRDPFFNYQPVDIIDVGVDKRIKQSILLDVDNVKLIKDKFSLVNVDYERFRFRLVDGLTIEEILIKYAWILDAEIEDAIIGKNSDGIVWYKGTWECGRWFGGTWMSGTWKSGDWYDGIWNSRFIKDRKISVEVDSKSIDETQSVWLSGRWFGGTWNSGVWYSGRWYDGTWNSGTWYSGIWNNGTWLSGKFNGGIWVDGTWLSGKFNCDNGPSYWLNGRWKGGDFENGIWYNGIFEEVDTVSKFGNKSYSSRTANWYSGQWLSGAFYSNENGVDTSKNHTYSIWKTGSWYSGDWYGGVAYNIDFKSGTWYGGILEEIQVVLVETDHLVLNGEFRFNNGDDVVILGTDDGAFVSIGNFKTPTIYKVIKSEIDSITKRTKLFIDFNSSTLPSIIEFETNLRVVSRFRNSTWKSGLWTNGYFESGLWEGGLFYNGLFEAKWM